MKNFEKKFLKSIADFSDVIAILSAGEVSYFGCYQPEEPESVRRAVEERRQAKIAKKMAKKNISIHIKK